MTSAPEFCRRALAWRPRRGRDEDERGDTQAKTLDETRRSCLEQMARRGMPLWREGPERCDGCGRELLLGEQAQLLRSGEALVLACPLCVPGFVATGYRLVVKEDDRGEQVAVTARAR